MPQIDHVVVLMLENRSFDHLFGTFPGANGVKGTEFNLLDPFKQESTTNPSFVVAAEAPFAISPTDGPLHSLKATNIQLSGNADGPVTADAALLNGFVASYSTNLKAAKVNAPTADMLRQPMLSFAPDQLPALTTLAREFVLCDQWFSEVPGPTQPNRLYTHCATSEGFAYNDWGRVIDVDTIYNRLEAAGLSWAVYYSDDNDVAKFSRVRAKAYTNPGEESESEQDRASGVLGAFFDFDTFFANHADAGKLPSYTFIEPAFGDAGQAASGITSMHAPHDVRPGDQLIARVYEALRSNEDTWKKTLLVITFDEHGGFYDHVVPPAAVNPDGINGDLSAKAPAFAFDRLGLRVPTILVSPWLPQGKVVSEALQHTSILSTLRNIFPVSDPLTTRDAAAKPFDSLLGEVFRDDTPKTLPHAQIPMAVSMAEAAEAVRPSISPDDLLEGKAKGWQEILAASTGDELPEATNLQEAHVLMRDAVKRFSRWQFERLSGSSH